MSWQIYINRFKVKPKNINLPTHCENL